MSYWYPDVLSQNEARAASRGGAISALVFAAMASLGVVVTLVQGQAANEPIGHYVGALVGMGIEIGLILFGAWRFWIFRGAFYGVLLLALFAIEIGMKIYSMTTGIGWFFLYAGVGAGLFNGIRAAWSFRRVGKGDVAWLDDLDETFG